MIDIDEVERDIERFVAIAIEAATNPEELLKVARAAASVGSQPLLDAVSRSSGKNASPRR